MSLKERRKIERDKIFRKEVRLSPRIKVKIPDDVQLIFLYNGKSYSGGIFDYSRFGLGVLLKTDLDTPKIGDTVTQIQIHGFDKTRNLGEGVIKYIDREETYNILKVHLLSEFIDLDILAEQSEFHLQEDEMKSVQMYFKYQEKVKSEFRDFTASFHFGLATFKNALDELDRKFKDEPPSLQEALFNALMQGIGLELKQYLDQSISKLKELVKGASRAEHQQNGFFLRRVIWPFIIESKVLARTNLKPRGYSGDATMMVWCYENQYVGDSSFGKIFHKHPVETKGAQAVRYRRKLIYDELDRYISEKESDRVRVMSVACGPATEMSDYLQNSSHAHQVELTLLDQDDIALNMARSSIESVAVYKNITVTYLRDSVRTLLKTVDTERMFGLYDFIYSMGLFDYLTKPVAVELLKKLFSMMAPGGRLIIGGFHKEHATRTYMEYIMDWVLYYRDEESFLELTEDLPGDFSAKIDFDPTHSQMFLTVTKK